MLLIQVERQLGLEGSLPCFRKGVTLAIFRHVESLPPVQTGLNILSSTSSDAWDKCCNIEWVIRSGTLAMIMQQHSAFERSVMLKNLFYRHAVLFEVTRHRVSAVVFTLMNSQCCVRDSTYSDNADQRCWLLPPNLDMEDN